MGERISATAFARRVGVTEGAVRKSIKRGLIRKGKDGLIDADHAKAAWENRDADNVLKGMQGAEAVSKSPPSEAARIPDNSLTRARAVSAALGAQRQKLELDRLQGTLIPKAEARAAVRQAITIITERLDGAAGQIGPRVAGNPSAAECEKIAREIINGIRADIARMADAVEAIGHAGRS